MTRFRTPKARRAPVAPFLPLRARHEPLEADTLVNDSLDLIEAHVRTVLDHGGEVALRARLARLLGNADATRKAGGPST